VFAAVLCTIILSAFLQDAALPGVISVFADAGGQDTAAYAFPNLSKVWVDGERVRAESYNIGGFNYFKLRTLAEAVDCAVWYDCETDTVYIDSSLPYCRPDASDAGGNAAPGGAGGVGGGYSASANNAAGPGGAGVGDDAWAFGDASSGGDAGAFGATVYIDDDANGVPAARASSDIIINGGAADFEVYTIGGYNYFKLRDFLRAADVNVRYDEAYDIIIINTAVSYDGECAVPGGYSPEAEHLKLETASVPKAFYATDVPGREIRECCERVIELVNAERAVHGVRELLPDEILFAIATYKCADMAELDYFDHASPSYGDLPELYEIFGVTFAIIGENIAVGYPTPESVMEAWMESPGHRANILDSEYNFIGVGLVYSADGLPLWAQEFFR